MVGDRNLNIDWGIDFVGTDMDVQPQSNASWLRRYVRVRQPTDINLLDVYTLGTNGRPTDRHSPPNILAPRLALFWDWLTLASHTEQLSLLMCFFKCSCRPHYRLSVKCLLCVLRPVPGVNLCLTAWWMGARFDLSRGTVSEIERRSRGGRRDAVRLSCR